MATLGSLVVNLQANLSQFQSSMNTASSMMENIGSKAQSIGKTMTVALTVPLVALGKKALDMASDVNESEDLFSESMGGMADKARAWSEALGNKLQLNANEIRGNVGVLDIMFKSMGLTEQGAYSFSTSLTQLSYDLSSLYNIDPTDAFQRLQSGMVGQSETVRKFGIDISDVALKQYALANGMIKAGQEMTTQQKIVARYGVIMNSTKVAQGNLDKTSGSFANRVRALKVQFDQLLISVGQMFLPLAQQLVTKLMGLIQWFNNLSPAVKQHILNFAMIVAVAGPVITVFGMIISFVGSMITAFGTIAGALSTVAGWFGLAGGSAGAFGAVITALSGPVGWVIGAIVAIVGVVIYLYKTNKTFADAIRTLWVEWGTIVSTYLKDVWTYISTVFGTAMKWIGDVLTIAVDILSLNWTDAWNAIKQFFVDIVNGIINIATSFANIFVDLWNNIKDKVIYLWGMLSQGALLAKNVVIGGFWDMMSYVGKAINWMGDKISGFYNKVADVAGMSHISLDMGGDNLTAYANQQKEGAFNAGGANISALQALQGQRNAQIKADKIAYEKTQQAKKTSKPTTVGGAGGLNLGNAPTANNSSLPNIDTSNYGVKADNSLIDPSMIDNANNAKDALKGTADGVDKVAEAMKNLSQNVSDMSKQFAEQIGLFDKFTKKTTSMATLLNRSKRRFDAYKDWQETQSELAGRSELSQSLKSQIAKMGVDKLGELKALAKSSSADLQAWNGYGMGVEQLSQAQAGSAVYQNEINVYTTSKDADDIADEIFKKLKAKGVQFA